MHLRSILCSSNEFRGEMYFCCGFSVSHTIPSMFYCFRFSALLCSAPFAFLFQCFTLRNASVLCVRFSSGPGLHSECKWLRSILTVTPFSLVSFHKNIFTKNSFVLNHVFLISFSMHRLATPQLISHNFWSSSKPMGFSYKFRFIWVEYQ